MPGFMPASTSRQTTSPSGQAQTLAQEGYIDTLNQALKKVPVWPLYALALVPAALLFWKALSGAAGPDPVRTLEHGLGSDALKFLIASLVVTPLRERVGINLLRFRRMIGLTAFFYVVLHFSAWLVFDRQFAWAAILADLTKRTYIIVGMVGLLLLIPLAISSNDAMVRRLGAINWRRLHMLAYPAAALAVGHYLWLVKTWTFEPLAYAFVVALLLLYRLLPKVKPAAKARTRMRASS